MTKINTITSTFQNNSETEGDRTTRDCLTTKIETTEKVTGSLWNKFCDPELENLFTSEKDKQWKKT